MLQIAIVSPLPPSLFNLRSLWRRGRFGRQVGASGHLLFTCAIIVTPLRGWGLPAFHPTKRNDRVILPADRSVAKVVVVPQTNITGLEITVSRDVSKCDRKRKQEARREVRLSEPRKVDRIYDQGLTGCS